MPIRAEMKPLYPPRREWQEIRERILARAKNTCECDGSCGVPHLGKWCEDDKKKCVLCNAVDDYDREVGT